MLEGTDISVTVVSLKDEWQVSATDSNYTLARPRQKWLFMDTHAKLPLLVVQTSGILELLYGMPNVNVLRIMPLRWHTGCIGINSYPDTEFPSNNC